MKTIKISSQLKFIVTSLAIAIITTSWQPVKAQSAEEKVPEIGWNSKLSSMGIDKMENIGKTYNFYCQAAAEDLIHTPIWGTNTYTLNSGICSAAVHAGMISEAGGTIKIELLAGQEFYTGSKKNKIKSEDHANTMLSYTFRGEALVNQATEQTQTSTQQHRPSMIERVMVNTLQRGVERSIERAITDIFN
jgi:hypothetical protein